MSNQPFYTPEQVLAITREPNIRWSDVAGGDTLANSIMMYPNSHNLQRQFHVRVQEQLMKYQVTGDPFHGNYPTAEALRQSLARVNDLFVLAALPTGLPFPMRRTDATKNILLIGTHDSGKSSTNIYIAGQLIRGGDTTVIIFEHKGAPVE